MKKILIIICLVFLYLSTPAKAQDIEFHQGEWILLPTTKLFHTPIVNAPFNITARFGKSTGLHFLGGFVGYFLLNKIFKDREIARWANISFTIGVEFGDASGQGLDPIDMAAGITGSLLAEHYFH